MLIALNSGLPKDALKELPKEICILKWGESPYNGGKLIVNSVSCASIPEMQKKYNFDRLALDFNHNSLESSPSYKGEPVKVAAYASLEVREGEGLFYKDIEWTEEGKESVQGGHYADISPSVLTNKKGEVIFVHSAALCRQGKVPGLQVFNSDFLTQNTNMENEQLKKYKALLCTILGLAEDVEDTTIEEVAENFIEKSKEPKTKEENSEGSEQIKALSSRIEQLEQRNEATEKSLLIKEAISQGKVLPMSAADMTLTTLKKVISALPANIVPMGQRTPEGVKQFSATLPKNSYQEAVCGQLGISSETFNKHNS